MKKSELKQLIKDVLLESFVDRRVDINNYLNDTLILGGLFKKNGLPTVFGSFSIKYVEQFRDYTPIAAYSKITKVE